MKSIALKLIPKEELTKFEQLKVTAASICTALTAFKITDNESYEKLSLKLKEAKYIAEITETEINNSFEPFKEIMTFCNTLKKSINTTIYDGIKIATTEMIRYKEIIDAEIEKKNLNKKNLLKTF